MAQVIPHPPPIANYAIVHSTRLRFITNVAVLQADITFQNLLDLILVGISATVVYDLFTAVKLRKIKMWAAPNLGTATTVECALVGATAGEVGDFRVVTDTSMGIEPAYISVRPAVQSLLSLFQVSGSGQALSLTCPSGTVIDLELTFRARPGLSLVAQNAAVGVAIGATYYRGLDGLAAASTKFVPVTEPI